ncbi:GGDEF domain-containing protein, partial [Clostridioides sp. ZZV15-6598]|nr:GGDEF domain-containing protein [Clostridioides sp. ZZV15-6598]
MTIICLVLIFYIIYDKLSLRVKLQKIVYTDALTGASTMDKFVIDAKKILSKNTQEKYALLYIDIDKFKYINDLFGYEVGNKILCSLTNIIKHNIFEEEIFARISADNFTIIMKYREEKDIINRLE